MSEIGRAAGLFGPGAYLTLPELPGGARSGWHVFGPDDQVGRLNLQTADRIVAAARLIRSGEAFSLNLDFGTVEPPMFDRESHEHARIEQDHGAGFDDRLDRFFPQASSHWDSLGHIAFEPGRFYNGATVEQISRGARNGIEHWASRGIAGRAVLLDIDALFSSDDPDYRPDDSRSIEVDDLERARVRAGVAWEPGDVVLLHTGFLAWYLDQPTAIREHFAHETGRTSVGLGRGPRMLEYLWDSGIAAVAADNPAVEAMPFDISPEARPFGFLHNCAIGLLGFALGELWWLRDLALRCREDGRYTAFLTSAPLAIPGGIGSPANALALR